ncbi:hypothetical protein MP228_010049 [Amoeboaphelidium protococcarum]|nr:hypothetical protein MP228_010049 [Amoeboaphelidium protococcarum]
MSLAKKKPNLRLNLSQAPSVNHSAGNSPISPSRKLSQIKDRIEILNGDVSEHRGNTPLTMQSAQSSPRCGSSSKDYLFTGDNNNYTKSAFSSPGGSSAAVVTDANFAATQVPYQDGPIEITDGVYLGSEMNARDADILESHNIRHIINVGIECQNHFIPQQQKSSSGTEISVGSHKDYPSSPMYNVMNLHNHTDQQVGGASVITGKKGKQSDADQKQSSEGMRSPITKTASDLHNLTIQTDDKSTKVNVPISYMHLKWTHNQEDVAQYFKQAFAFIDQSKRDGSSVLIHCKQGLSRSAALMIAYMMHQNKWTFNQAYDHVKRKSPSISPNLNLVYQLHEYEKSL